MARRPVTRELYDLMLAGFRESPGNASYAARAAGCERRMAARGWAAGWPAYPWARPIRKVVAEEQLEAERRSTEERRRDLQEAEAKRKESAEVSVRSWMRVGSMLALQREALYRQAGVTSQMAAATLKLAPRVAQALEAMAAEPELPPLPTTLRVLSQTTVILDKLAKAISAHVAAERLFHNEPTAQEMPSAEGVDEVLSLEEGLRRVEAAGQALASVRDGHLRVIRGGADDALKDPAGGNGVAGLEQARGWDGQERKV